MNQFYHYNEMCSLPVGMKSRYRIILMTSEFIYHPLLLSLKPLQNIDHSGVFMICKVMQGFYFFGLILTKQILAFWLVFD